MSVRIAAALPLGVLAALAAPATAQIRASERGVTSQTVDGTVITVDYARPQIRGRDSVFATKGKGIVYWGEIWTPGANWATTLELSKPVTLNGQEVAAGKYSVWFIPQPTEWTIGLHANPRLFHTQPPKDSAYVVTFKATPQAADHRADVLQFSFPAVTHTGTTLRMHWDRTSVDIAVGVRPSRPPVNMTAQQMAPYLGSFTLKMEDDTSGREQKAEVIAAGNELRIVVDGWGKFTIGLVPKSGHRYMTVFLEDGKVYDEEEAAEVVFDVQGGQAVGFTIVDLTENKPWMTARRRAD
jgi:hypothetical protein